MRTTGLGLDGRPHRNSRKVALDKRCRGCGEPLYQRDGEQARDWIERQSCGRGCHAMFKGAVPVWVRFAENAIPVESGCIEWNGYVGADGYGRIVAPGDTLAHRVAYRMAHGNIGVGMMICHRCDNRLCVNPAHLFVGTSQDNMDDMVRKGRSADNRGQRNPNWRHGRYVQDAA